MSSAYHRIGNLATHPAFSYDYRALVCMWTYCVADLDDRIFHRAGEYDRHYLAHDPTAEHAWRWLTGKTCRREAERRGWPSFEEMLARESGS